MHSLICGMIGRRPRRIDHAQSVTAAACFPMAWARPTHTYVSFVSAVCPNRRKTMRDDVFFCNNSRFIMYMSKYNNNNKNNNNCTGTLRRLTREVIFIPKTLGHRTAFQCGLNTRQLCFCRWRTGHDFRIRRNIEEWATFWSRRRPNKRLWRLLAHFGRSYGMVS